MDLSILSRLKRRVEAGLAAGALLAIAGVVPSAHAEMDEPDPWPQVEVPAHSDYAEAKELLRQRKWEEGAIVLRSVLKRSPDFFPGAIELARALVYLGRREEALALLSQTVAKQKGSRKMAVIARERVLSRMFLTYKNFQVYQDGLNQLQQRKYRVARERFEQALAVEPDNVEVLTRIGQSLVLEGDHDSAAERLRLAKRLNPYEPEVSLWLGRALHQRGELAQAIEELKVAHDGLKGSERTAMWYAEALVAAGARRVAVQMLEKDVETRPFHLAGVVALAKLRTDLFREGADSLWTARKDLQVALSRLPDYSAGEAARRSESELGVELGVPAAELKTQITTLLAQLDGRLQDTQPQRPAMRPKRRGTPSGPR